MPDFEALLQTAILASVAAGSEIMDVYETAFNVTLKDDRSPLTEADRRSHTRIVSDLLHTGIPVLSEEGRQTPWTERSGWEMYWLVDPLDGTREFIQRNGEFTVNIALIQSGKPVAGVIYVPVDDVLYYGATWLPSRRVDQARSLFSGNRNSPAAASAGKSLPLPIPDRPVTVVASRSHFDEHTRAFLDSLRIKFGELQYVSRGSSLKMCLVAEGAADIYPRLAPTMEWDTAAGQAIAECAGCTVVQAGSGEPVVYNKTELLNPHFIVSRIPFSQA